MRVFSFTNEASILSDAAMCSAVAPLVAGMFTVWRINPATVSRGFPAVMPGFPAVMPGFSNDNEATCTSAK